jgi:hypothetical protein
MPNSSYPNYLTSLTLPHDDIGGFHNLPSDCDRDILGNLGENAELSKNGVIKETDDNNKCKIVCEETNNINVLIFHHFAY